MSKSTVTEKFGDYSVRREAATGRFVDVKTPKGTSRLSASSGKIVSSVSSKREGALKRLVNR